MAQCEDYPCCGHTDGLGCDWVSPFEVVPCQVCIEARKSYPYHAQADGCPTVRERAVAEALSQQVPCEFYGVEDECEGEVASTMYGDTPVCWDCFSSMKQYDREVQEQYDEEWSRR